MLIILCQTLVITQSGDEKKRKPELAADIKFCFPRVLVTVQLIKLEQDKFSIQHGNEPTKSRNCIRPNDEGLHKEKWYDLQVNNALWLMTYDLLFVDLGFGIYDLWLMTCYSSFMTCYSPSYSPWRRGGRGGRWVGRRWPRTLRTLWQMWWRWRQNWALPLVKFYLWHISYHCVIYCYNVLP